MKTRHECFEDFEIGDVYRARLGRTITDTPSVWVALRDHRHRQRLDQDRARRYYGGYRCG